MEKEIKSDEETLLLFEEVTFYFIYPFVFEPENWNEINHCFINGIPEARLGWLPTKITKCSFEDQKFCWVNPFNPIEKNGQRSKHDVILNGIDYSGQTANISANISTLLRIRKSGIGTITFEIKYKKKDSELINFDELDPFFRITPRTWTNLLHNKISQSDSTKKHYLTTLTNSKDNSTSQSLFSLFESIIKSIKANKINSMKFFFSRRLDKQIPQYGIYNNNEFITQIKKNFDAKDPLTDTLHPYLYFTGQLEKAMYAEYFLNFNSKQCDIINKQIASILFRLYVLKQSEFLNLDFISQELNSINIGDNKLSSDNLNSKVYTQIHRMASLTFYYKDVNLEYFDIPYSALHPSIIDILENTRSKWESLFHSNLVLDIIIFDLNKISNLANKGLGDSFRALLKVERLIALSLADPNILLYDGHVAFDAVKSVYEKMNISSLSNLVQEKKAMVSSLLNHANSLKYFDITTKKVK
jgi:hypothetical protein